MKPITKVVSAWAAEYFNDTDIEISEDKNRATYQFTGSDKGDFEYIGFVDGYEDRPGLIVILIAPFKVSQQHCKAVAEVLALVNYGLLNGAIGMDMQDGEIRYKTSVDLMDGVISVAMINNMVDGGISFLDQYLPAITAVIYGGRSPEVAFAIADKSSGAISNEIGFAIADKSSGEISNDGESANKVMPAEIRLWESFAGSDPVRAWADDIKSALSNRGNMKAWELAGRAAVIVNEDKNYCNEVLRRVAVDNDMDFAAVAACDVMDMPPSSGLKDLGPILIHLEPGHWMKAKEDSDESEKTAGNVREFQSRLTSYLRSFNPDHPIVYVVSARKLSDVAARLRKVGLFERFIFLPQEPLEAVAESFLKQIGKECCGDSLLNSLGKIGKLLKSEVDSADQRKLAALCLRRLYLREKKPLEFFDLVHVVSHSLQEEGISINDSEDLHRQKAYHEAGHAVMAALDSGGKNIPEYASIVPSVAFSGIVIESYAFHHAHDDIHTYRDFRHNIRICLAGRAAEEVFYGVEGISSGAAGDLEDASRHASKAFSYWGFAPQMEYGECSGSNLGVVFGGHSPSEMKHVEGLVRHFLEKEYEVVKTMLAQNRSLLDAVAERLVANPILNQDELSAIFSARQIA